MDILKQFEGKINGTLETFDRVIINGYIQCLHSFRLFLYYLIQKNILLKDFDAFAKKQTDSLCSHIESYIKEQDCTLTYLASGQDDKGALARKSFEKSPDKTGLVCAFSVVESCKTMTVKPNRETKKLEVTSRTTKCKHYYFYYNDEEFGWMFLKIQTWFPYNIQIYLNGREYLSRLLSKEDIHYAMYNNSFSYIEDFGRAQGLADGILNKKLSASFDGMAEKTNCLLPDIMETMHHSYYWCVDQCEFATDINFKSREELGSFYKTLVETTYFTFSSHDIYSFFGRNVEKIHTFRKGEIISDLRHRCQGYRIKFKINKNQIKMYDKGNNLRIEVTINNPRDFKIPKEKEKVQDGKIVKSMEWIPMGKSIANLYRYAEISKAIIKRYLSAMPDIPMEKVPEKDIMSVSAPKKAGGRRYSGFNLLSEETILILSIIASGDFILNGFDNKSLRRRIYKNSGDKKAAGKITRLLSKLKAHGLIKKVPRKNRYYLTSRGRNITNALLLFLNKELLNAA